MEFTIEIDENTVELSIMRHMIPNIIEFSHINKLHKIIKNFINDESKINKIIEKVIIAFIEREIKTILKVNNESIIQILREEVSKICKNTLEEYELIKKLNGVK